MESQLFDAETSTRRALILGARLSTLLAAFSPQYGRRRWLTSASNSTATTPIPGSTHQWCDCSGDGIGDVDLEAADSRLARAPRPRRPPMVRQRRGADIRGCRGPGRVPHGLAEDRAGSGRGSRDEASQDHPEIVRYRHPRGDCRAIPAVCLGNHREPSCLHDPVQPPIGMDRAADRGSPGSTPRLSATGSARRRACRRTSGALSPARRGSSTQGSPSRPTRWSDRDIACRRKRNGNTLVEPGRIRVVLMAILWSSWAVTRGTRPHRETALVGAGACYPTTWDYSTRSEMPTNGAWAEDGLIHQPRGPSRRIVSAARRPSGRTSRAASVAGLSPTCLSSSAQRIENGSCRRTGASIMASARHGLCALIRLIHVVECRGVLVLVFPYPTGERPDGPIEPGREPDLTLAWDAVQPEEPLGRSPTAPAGRERLQRAASRTPRANRGAEPGTAGIGRLRT